MKKIIIALSILSADFGKLNEEIKEVENFAGMLHVDVMDGHFVPNITIGPDVVKAIESKLPLDVHLMIENPEKYVDKFIDAGASIIVFHKETSKDPEKLIAHIKERGVKAGIAINPDTKAETLDNLLDKLDMILVMSVHPGFGGQKFIESSLEKIKYLRKRTEVDIEVDGGINKETISKAIEAGANVIVAGSAIFSKENREQAIKELKEEIK